MFSVPARTQYAIRAMVHLARLPDRSATAAEIAAAEGIPVKYLEGIMTRLKLCGLVESERGKNGGYSLRADPAELSMLSIVEAMDGSVKPVSCVEGASVCAQGGGCLPRKFWLGLKDAIDLYLKDKTLRDVTEA